MSLPSNTHGQPSIRNFFRPKQPVYASPPSASKRSTKTVQAPASIPSPPLAPTATIPTSTEATSLMTPTAQPTAAIATATIKATPLHPQASISRIRPEHISALRRITSLLLPISYPDSFYARLSDPLSSGAFSRVILWRDEKASGSSAPAKVIGGLVCRPEPSPFHTGSVHGSPARTKGPTLPSAQPNALYIQSLVLLSPYRGLGLAAALLDEVVADAVNSEFACESVWAHVWTQNDEGLRWYKARGFACVDEIKKYYHKLRPDSAWIVRRQIGPAAAMLGLDGSPSSAATTTPVVGESRDANPVPPAQSVTAAAANLPLTSSGFSPSPTSPPARPNSVPTPTTTAPPPPIRPAAHPLPTSRSTPGQSFQNTRPETEWNDLPLDMQSAPNNNKAATANSSSLSVPGSGASSRSSSSARKKRDRAYPAAAFGN
ncbi:acyl-CoA N-acyltransferase [Nemania sp. FL0916]|nr:acyl-CoA N-acyltransferase [Nemania sp. FL0916]